MITLLRGTFLTFLVLIMVEAPAQSTFIIESLPDATPADDTIYICGSFNNWVPNDPRYALERQRNGQLSVNIPTTSDTIEYKFTRGSWTKVETDAANQYTANRRYFASEPGHVFITIDNWLDLGGARRLSYTTFYFFACAFQGLLLCLLLLRIPKKDNRKLISLFMINGALIAMYIIIVLNETTAFWQRYAGFIFQVGLFAWGPLVMCLVYAFLQHSIIGLRFYFVPFFLMAICNVSQVLNIDVLSTLSLKVVGPLSLGDLVCVTGSTLLNIVLVRKILIAFPSLKKLPMPDESARITFIFYLLWTTVVAVTLVPIILLSGIGSGDTYFIGHYYVVAILLSFIIFIEAYYLWRYPDILREEKQAPSATSQPQEWIRKLDATMRESKIFRKHDLNVYELAEIIGMKPHNLSKLVNEACRKNFRDFVNAYRIEEFISLAEQKQFKHYTFFALAQEAGFNSKSTFNLAFKKYTNQSPREYFRDKQVSELQSV